MHDIRWQRNVSFGRKFQSFYKPENKNESSRQKRTLFNGQLFIICGNNSSIELDAKNTNVEILILSKISMWMWCWRLLSALSLNPSEAFINIALLDGSNLYAMSLCSRCITHYIDIFAINSIKLQISTMFSDATGRVFEEAFTPLIPFPINQL